MLTFIKIFGLILFAGVLSAITDHFVLKKKDNVITTCLVYSAEYYLAIALARVIEGNRLEQLSYSFFNKAFQGYIKAFILLIVVYVANYVLSRFIKHSFDRFRNQTIGIYALIELLCIIFVGDTRMETSLIIAAIAVPVSIICFVVLKPNAEEKGNERILMPFVFIQLLAFCIQHYIAGPSELYAYNGGEFIYDYKTLIPHLIIGTLVVAVFFTILICNTLQKQIVTLATVAIAIYNIAGYIQYFFLNGKLSALDGSRQTWTLMRYLLNTAVWLLIAAVLLVIVLKRDKGLTIVTWLSVYIIAVQMVAVVYSLLTTDVLAHKSEQIVSEGAMELSGNDNVVVFVLDAYDVQEISMVLSDDPAYLAPLCDFTYYDNMKSRYYYTDFSLPYFLTGGGQNLDVKEKGETYDWYKESSFLPEISEKGYKINVLTEKKYVDKFEDPSIIANYTTENYCILDTERALSSFSKTIRYRNMPFILKGLYEYSFFDLSDIVVDTNIYKFGRDDLIDDIIRGSGISINDSAGTFCIYHMYGAHAPYFVNEDGKTDYSGSTPLAQFKGCLRIVYDYIETIKNEGLYDNTTIIITADHGLNPGQVDALKNAGVTCDESSSNPIFFIKCKAEDHEEMVVDHHEVSHDQLFDTIMRCIDDKWANQYFGTIWD